MTDRAIPLRMRKDLLVVSTGSPRRPRWTVKDPLSLRYFGLNEHEHAVLVSLNGRISFPHLVEQFRRRFPGTDLTPHRFAGFVSRLAQSGLVVASGPGLGQKLADLTQRQTRRQRVRSLLNPFAIRVGGIDPERILRRLEPLTRIVLSPSMLAAAGLLCVAAAGMVVLRFDDVVARLPSLAALASPANVVLLAVMWVLIKVVHELAHAAVCRRFGGECHDVGILFLVFLPLFYCDVSDAWTIPNRWHRIAISFAGIAVELCLAAVLTVLWWNSLPGFANTLFLNGMLVCSIGTVLFNGNPLLRYDGYHVLGDLLEIPNLGEQSRAAIWNVFDRLVLGDESAPPPVDGNRLLLVTYGAASAAYRILVIGLIGWFLLLTTAQWELHVLGGALTLLLALGVALPFAAAIVSRTKHLAKAERRRRGRAFAGLVVLGIAAGGILLFPFPYFVEAPFVTGPGDADAVFARVSGRIESAVVPGTRVAEGETLFVLTDSDRDRLASAYAAEVARLQSRLKTLEAARATSAAAAHELPAVQDQLAAAVESHLQIQREQRDLIVLSPRNGVVLPVRNRQANAIEDSTQLPAWSGRPTHPYNNGARIEAATMLCLVGDPHVINAQVIVDEASIHALRAGQVATLQFRSNVQSRCEGRVADVALLPTETIPPELISLNLIESQSPTARYQVTVRITEGEEASMLYTPGTARIRCGTRSPARRIRDALRTTFGFDLAN